MMGKIILCIIENVKNMNFKRFLSKNRDMFKKKIKINVDTICKP